MRKIRGTTVVITGATSGIGRETARAFSRRGARIVAAGRRDQRLADLVREIGDHGGKILAVRTDVAEHDQVRNLIERAHQHFGSVDTLVNNAGIGLAAAFDSQSLEDFRRLMEVNFWGAVHSCREVVPIMKQQTNGGLIVNVSSILGKRGMPFETAYCSSKFALAGFSEALRAELQSEGIDVSTIFPGAVESEIWQAAKNRTGFEVPEFLPKFPAEDLARILVANARFPQPEVVMSLDAQALNFFNRLAPGMVDFMIGKSTSFLRNFTTGTDQGDTPSEGEAGDEGERRPRR